ncbi:MAG: SDR family NAD(P)-dependent oxidoreductase [Acidimicrobiia bacterium]
MVELDDRVALITGGASGIGAAAARLLHEHGARVCIVDLPNSDGEAMAAELDGLFAPADVGESAEVDAAFDACDRELGGIDIAFLNAGVTVNVADPVDLTDEAYRRIMRVNLDGVVFGTRAAARCMTRRGGGDIVATASLAGLVAVPVDPAYAATKHAVVGWIRSVAPTLAAHGIRCNCLCPGFVDTPLLAPVRHEFVQVGFPLLDQADIAGALLTVLRGGATGEAWVCQPGREPVPFRFPNVPGPRTPGAEGRPPPAGLTAVGPAAP